MKGTLGGVSGSERAPGVEKRELVALGDILESAERNQVYIRYNVVCGLVPYLPLVGLLGLISFFELDELRLRRWFCG